MFLNISLVGAIGVCCENSDEDSLFMSDNLISVVFTICQLISITILDTLHRPDFNLNYAFNLI